MFAEVTHHEWSWPEAFAFVGFVAALAAVVIVFIIRASKD